MSETGQSASSTRWGEVIELRPQQVVQIALLGAGAGIVIWLLSALVKQIILVPLFCGDPTTSLCVTAPSTAGNIATILAGVLALLGLVRLSVYRPLIIVIAAAISLWGLNEWVTGLAWYEGIAWAILLYAIAYVLFAWLVRPRPFAPAAILVVIAVLMVRLLPLL